MATKLTHERGKVYGPPKINHSRTARLITAYLHNKGLGSSFKITAEDVCVFNILQKVARIQQGANHLDNLTDIAGYTDNIKEIWNDA
tara:strand:+ start:165 stop:425 length:261 start_codon:yes stop_codon:yes gene_type:complete